VRIRKQIAGLTMMGLLTGCGTQYNQTLQTLSPTKKYYSKNTKKVQRSVHANFQNNEGQYCEFYDKTILVELKPNGAGEFIACQDNTIKRHGVVSSGKPGTHDTVRGDFRTTWKAHEWDSKKYPSDVEGQYNMKRSMFFFDGFAIHHGNVNGLSHGCVRTQMTDADWLYEWSPIGTRIIVEDAA